MKILMPLADHRQRDSWAARLRQQRHALFRAFIAPLPRPLTILDVGGTQQYWEQVGLVGPGIHITLLNSERVEVSHPAFRSVVGDARAMPFGEQAFEVVFSNSVIEHVGETLQQRQMAEEMRRVGRRYFLQTPNRYFPIEPHFLVPGFQFFPLSLRAFLVRQMALGWYPRVSDPGEAATLVRSITLLSREEVMALFPEGQLHEEKIAGLIKSFVVYHDNAANER